MEVVVCPFERSTGILEAFKELVEPYTKDDPERLLLWTNKSFHRDTANGTR